MKYAIEHLEGQLDAKRAQLVVERNTVVQGVLKEQIRGLVAGIKALRRATCGCGNPAAPGKRECETCADGIAACA